MEEDVKEIVVKSENDKLSDIERKLDYISNHIDEFGQTFDDSLPIPIDMRYARTIMRLNDEYYGLFANMKNSLEVVPFAIIEKGIAAATKSYKKDLRQVKREYSKILKRERQNSHIKNDNS